MTENRHWAVGHTPPGSEAKARDRLRDHGCEVYLPVYPGWARPGGKRKPECFEQPLFPSYLFIDMQPFLDCPLPSIVSLAGLVSWGGHLTWDHSEMALLCDAAISQVREIEGEAAVAPQSKPALVFVIGERVRIVGRSFDDRYGRVVRVRNGGVEMEGLGRRVFVRDLTKLERCAS